MNKQRGKRMSILLTSVLGMTLLAGCGGILILQTETMRR